METLTGRTEGGGVGVTAEESVTCERLRHPFCSSHVVSSHDCC